MEEQKTPYILIDRRFEGLPAHFVGVDDVEVGRIATEHLIEVGCRQSGTYRRTGSEHCAWQGRRDIAKFWRSTAWPSAPGLRDHARAWRRCGRCAADMRR